MSSGQCVRCGRWDCSCRTATENVYARRQQTKQVMDDSRTIARKWMRDAFGDGGTVSEHANVHPMPDGAFVEAQIWVPRVREHVLDLDSGACVNCDHSLDKPCDQTRYPGNEF